MIDTKAIDTVLAIFLPLIHAHRKKTSKPFVLGLPRLREWQVDMGRRSLPGLGHPAQPQGQDLVAG